MRRNRGAVKVARAALIALVLALMAVQWWLHQRQLEALESELSSVAASVGKDMLSGAPEGVSNPLQAEMDDFMADPPGLELDARAMDPDLPLEMSGAMDAERYHKSQEYARARLRFEAVTETASLVVF